MRGRRLLWRCAIFFVLLIMPLQDDGCDSGGTVARGSGVWVDSLQGSGTYYQCKESNSPSGYLCEELK